MSRFPFVDLKAQYRAYRDELDASMSRVVSSASFIMGPEVHELEAQLAAYVGSRYAITCANGTDALQLALMVLGVGPGDEVIVPAFTFIATAEVVPASGATVVFADVDEETFTMDPASVDKLVSPRTKAVIPVGLFGQPADMDQINALGVRHGFAVVDDAAQSFGAEYHGRRAGGLAHISCTSFFPSKPLGCYGDGGAVFTDDEKVGETIGSLRLHGQSGRYVHDRIGVNSRLDTVQAAVLLVKLAHLDDELQRRREAAGRYDRLLADSGARLPRVAEHRVSTWAQYTVRVPERDLVRERLAAAGVPSAVHYPAPAYHQAAFAAAGTAAGSCPVAERLCKEVLSLPICAFLREEDQRFACAQLRSVLEGLQDGD